MNVSRILAFAALLVFGTACSALAQGASGLTYVPLGQCQMTGITSAALITPSNCNRASFTGTGFGTTLTASSVTGLIQVGDQITGTGVLASPNPNTYIASQVSGTPGGAGVFTTNQATTASAASLSAGGVPLNAAYLTISVETQAIRYRDDGQNPTTAVGVPIAVGQTQNYSSTLSKLRLIAQTAGAVVDLAFYRSTVP